MATPRRPGRSRAVQTWCADVRRFLQLINADEVLGTHTQKMPLRTRRSFTLGTPRGLFGSIGLMAIHSSLESSYRMIRPPRVRGLNHGSAVRLNGAATDGNLVAIRPEADALCSFGVLSGL